MLRYIVRSARVSFEASNRFKFNSGGRKRYFRFLVRCSQECSAVSPLHWKRLLGRSKKTVCMWLLSFFCRTNVFCPNSVIKARFLFCKSGVPFRHIPYKRFLYSNELESAILQLGNLIRLDRSNMCQILLRPSRECARSELWYWKPTMWVTCAWKACISLSGFVRCRLAAHSSMDTSNLLNTKRGLSSRWESLILSKASSITKVKFSRTMQHSLYQANKLYVGCKNGKLMKIGRRKVCFSSLCFAFLKQAMVEIKWYGKPDHDVQNI